MPGGLSISITNLTANVNGAQASGTVVTLTATLASAITVSAGTPTIGMFIRSDGAALPTSATYTGGSGTTTWTFTFTLPTAHDIDHLATASTLSGGATLIRTSDSASVTSVTIPTGDATVGSLANNKTIICQEPQYWTGASSSAYKTAGNWSGNTVPSSATYCAADVAHVSGSSTIQLDTATTNFIGRFDMTSFTGTLDWNGSTTGATLNGSIIFGSGMTVTGINSTNGLLRCSSQTPNTIQISSFITQPIARGLSMDLGSITLQLLTDVYIVTSVTVSGSSSTINSAITRKTVYYKGSIAEACKIDTAAVNGTINIDINFDDANRTSATSFTFLNNKPLAGKVTIVYTGSVIVDPGGVGKAMGAVSITNSTLTLASGATLQVLDSAQTGMALTSVTLSSTAAGTLSVATSAPSLTMTGCTMTTSASTWFIAISPGSTCAAHSTTFSHCDASAGRYVDATDTCVDSGSNSNFDFNKSFHWTGATNNVWTTATNWTENVAPNSLHHGQTIVVTGSASLSSVFLTGFKELDLSGFTGTLSAHTITGNEPNSIVRLNSAITFTGGTNSKADVSVSSGVAQYATPLGITLYNNGATVAAVQAYGNFVLADNLIANSFQKVTTGTGVSESLAMGANTMTFIAGGGGFFWSGGVSAALTYSAGAKIIYTLPSGTANLSSSVSATVLPPVEFNSGTLLVGGSATVTLASFTQTGGLFDPNHLNVTTVGNWTTTAGSFQNLPSGTMTVGGNFSSSVSMTSAHTSGADTTWNLNVTGTAAFHNATVAYCNASGGVIVIASDNCVDGTNNTHVTFAAAPTVTSVAASSGPVAGGTSVTITGTGFSASISAVTFGGTAATSVVRNSSTSITCTTPAHAGGAVDVVVTNSDTQTGTGTNAFTFTSAPTVSSVSASSGPSTIPTAVTITGTGFSGVTGVTFGGNAATSIITVNSTTVTCVTPTHAAGAVNVVVTNGDTTTGTGVNAYTYVAAPTVSSVSANHGPITGGRSVLITGTGFNSVSDVKFGGVSATDVVTVNPTSITCTTPIHAVGAVTVAVTNGDAQTGSLGSAFTYSDTTTFTDSGDHLWTNGANWYNGAPNNNLNVVVTGGVTIIIDDNVACKSLDTSGMTGVWDQSTFHSIAVLGNISIGNFFAENGVVYVVASASGTLTMDPDASYGYAALDLDLGASITVTLGSDVRFAFVRFTASYNRLALGTHRCVLAADAGTVGMHLEGNNLTWATGGGIDGIATVVTASVSFSGPGVATADLPPMTIVATASAFGVNFAGGVGSVASLDFSDGTLDNQTIPVIGAAVAHNSTITSCDFSDGAELDATDNCVDGLGNLHVDFGVPSITSVTPATGLPDGGEAISIAGINFGGATVDIDGIPCTSIVVVSPTLITCVTPPHAVGAVTLTVTDLDNETGTADFLYTIVLPEACQLNTVTLKNVSLEPALFVTGALVAPGATLVLDFVGLSCSRQDKLRTACENVALGDTFTIHDFDAGE